MDNKKQQRNQESASAAEHSELDELREMSITQSQVGRALLEFYDTWSGHLKDKGGRSLHLEVLTKLEEVSSRWFASSRKLVQELDEEFATKNTTTQGSSMSSPFQTDKSISVCARETYIKLISLQGSLSGTPVVRRTADMSSARARRSGATGEPSDLQQSAEDCKRFIDHLNGQIRQELGGHFRQFAVGIEQGTDVLQ